MLTKEALDNIHQRRVDEQLAKLRSSQQGDSLRMLRLSLLALLVLAVLLYLFFFHKQTIWLAVIVSEWAKGTGVAGIIVFILIDAVFVSTMLPGVIFTVLAGAVWGLLLGFVIAVSGKFIGAMVAFFLGRYVCSPCAFCVRGIPRWDEISEAVGRSGWKISLLLRLSPIIPYNLLNYAFALSSISLFAYTWTSLLGMMPGTAGLVYLGHVAGGITASVHAEEEWTWERILFLSGGVVVSLVFVTLTNFIIRWEMAKILNPQELPIRTYTPSDSEEKVDPAHHE